MKIQLVTAVLVAVAVFTDIADCSEPKVTKPIPNPTISTSPSPSPSTAFICQDGTVVRHATGCRPHGGVGEQVTH